MEFSSTPTVSPCNHLPVVKSLADEKFFFGALLLTKLCGLGRQRLPDVLLRQALAGQNPPETSWNED
jgi:hypothetical protein